MAKKIRGGKVFQYHIRRASREKLPEGEPMRISSGEGLTGFVQGLEASDIEERFARALDKLGSVRYTFRTVNIAGRWKPGSIELDFTVFHGGETIPVQIDGTFAHKGIVKQAEDAVKDQFLNNAFQGAARPVERIPGDLLGSQEDADKLVRERFG